MAAILSTAIVKPKPALNQQDNEEHPDNDEFNKGEELVEITRDAVGQHTPPLSASRRIGCGKRCRSAYFKPQVPRAPSDTRDIQAQPLLADNTNFSSADL
jgi:hypothetical protein